MPAAAGQPGSARVLRAIRSEEEIRLDGRLDEAAWQAAPVADGFIQRDPEEGRPATERTELRLLFDDARGLRRGAHARQRARPLIARQLSRRDDERDADSFAFYLDPMHDHLTGAALR